MPCRAAILSLSVLAAASLDAAAAESNPSSAPKPSIEKIVDWGSETGGWRSRIWSNQTTFGSGEPIPIRYCIQNVSTTAQTIWHRGFWPDHEIELIGPEETPVNRRSAESSAPGSLSEKTVPVLLQPNEIDAAYPAYDLRDLFTFNSPGVYKVRYTYKVSKTISVHSNWLRFSLATAQKEK